jgi:hypothetical protein
MKAMSGLAVLIASMGTPSFAAAQQIPFERTIEVSGSTSLDVTTDRGRIEVVPGQPGRIVVAGAATVRVGMNVPANAVDIAQRVAAAPPIEHAANTVFLRVPAERDAQQAVTVSYRVQVPPMTEVHARTSSGATSIRGVVAPVDVRTQSAAIDLGDLSGTIHVSTGSGAVAAHNISGPLTVATESSSFNGSGLGSALHVRTGSGAIEAVLAGNGAVDVETGSSAIRLRGVRGSLTAKTQSGQITVEGSPDGPWTVTTSSSKVDFELPQQANFTLDASSRSGSVGVTGATVSGSATKSAVKGTVGSGGPTVFVRTGSGAIHVRLVGK